MSFSIIIPSKTISNLIPCIRAIELFNPGHQIIVIDDGLDLEKDYPGELDRSIVLFGEKPFIFARNCNAGIRQALRSPETSGVILLNDDALLETEQGFSKMAAACIEGGFGIMGASTDLGHRNQHRRGFGVRTVDHFAYVCVFIPRSTIDIVGTLDERFTAYGYEDNDYNLRVRQARLQPAVFDGCFVCHSKLVSTFRGAPKNPGDVGAAREIFRRKWGFVET